MLRDIREKLDRIALFLTWQRVAVPLSNQGEWDILQSAILTVEQCQRQAGGAA